MSEAAPKVFPRVADREGRLPFGLPLELTVDDPDTVRELMTFREGDPRERFALNALLAWWLLGEAVTPMRVLGIGIIIVGVFLVARS